jgi:DNA-binding winged helix-turn-helix (wHTH) protein
MRLQFGEFTIDSSSRQLTSSRSTPPGRPVPLSPKAFDALLLLLAERPNVVTKSALLDRVWPDAADVSDGNLTVVIAEMRRALGDNRHTPRYVRTVHRFGYAFCGEAADLTAGQSTTRADDAPRPLLAWNDRTTSLVEGDNVVGRDPGCAVWLDVPGVSRRHARIRVRGQMATIEDLGSTNGTFVDDAAVTAGQELADGQKIQFGPLEVRFRLYSPTVRTEKTVRVPR